jgi:hypothetical protein
VALAEALEEVAHGVVTGEVCDAQERVQSLVRAQPIGMGEAPRPCHQGDEKRHQGLGRRDRVVARVGEGHQLADLSGQPDALEERDQADQSAKRRDRLGSGTDLDLSPGENRTTKTLHRLVMGHGWCLFNTTLLPHGFTPNDALSNFGFRIKTKFRVEVSMMTQLGMEVDTRKCTPEYLDACREGIEVYKKVRPVVQLGDQYHHAHPFDSPTPSMNYVSKDKQQALVLAYQTGKIQKPIHFAAPVSGLDPECVYKLAEVNLPKDDNKPRVVSGVQLSQTGQAWMASGVPLQFTRPYDSAVVLLDAVE